MTDDSTLFISIAVGIVGVAFFLSQCGQEQMRIDFEKFKIEHSQDKKP